MASSISKIIIRGILGNLKKTQVPKNLYIPRETTSMLTPPEAICSVLLARSFASRPYTTKKLPLKKKSEYYLSDSDDEAESKAPRKIRGTTDFWRRKMRTIHNLLDFNKDGVVSYDDFKLFADNFINLGHISEKSANEFRELIKRTWETQWGPVTPYNLVTVEQYLEDMRHVVNDAERAGRVDAFLPYLFEAIDTDRSGKVTLAEFKLFFECLGHSGGDALFTFRVIDMDADGAVDKGEFLRYGRDYFLTEDESRISKYFWGPLVA